ncbi:hypothetical protein JXO52_11150 [bacterium]|nr:hypothetical protein [bacterium]
MRSVTRILLLMLAAVIAAGLLTGSSCDNGSGSKSSGSIIGTWLFDRVTIYDTPIGDMDLSASSFLNMSETGVTSMTLQVNEDGTAALTDTFADGSDTVIPGTWTEVDGDVTIIGAGMDENATFDVDGNTLTVTIRMGIDFDLDGVETETRIDMIYKRV